jgi:hypothetical protein
METRNARGCVVPGLCHVPCNCTNLKGALVRTLPVCRAAGPRSLASRQLGHSRGRAASTAGKASDQGGMQWRIIRTLPTTQAVPTTPRTHLLWIGSACPQALNRIEGRLGQTAQLPAQQKAPAKSYEHRTSRLWCVGRPWLEQGSGCKGYQMAAGVRDRGWGVS